MKQELSNVESLYIINETVIKEYIYIKWDKTTKWHGLFFSEVMTLFNYLIIFYMYIIRRCMVMYSFSKHIIVNAHVFRTLFLLDNKLKIDRRARTPL
jgi:hypothetical protein